MPSTRIEKFAGAVASASFVTVTEMLGLVPTHPASPIDAPGSGPTSGSISHPLSRTDRPSGQFSPSGSSGGMGGMMSPQLSTSGPKIGPVWAAWPSIAADSATAIWLYGLVRELVR